MKYFRFLKADFREIRYFLGYLKADFPLVFGVVLLSLLASLLRLPLMYLPTILTAHFDYPDVESGDVKMGSNLSYLLARKLIVLLWNHFGSPGYLTAAVSIAAGGILLLAPMQMIRSYVAGLVGGNLILRIRTELFNNLQWLSMLSVYDRGAGPFVQRMTRDMFIVHDLLVNTLPGIVGLVLQIVVFLVAMLILQFRLTIAVVITYLLLLPFLFRFNRGIQIQASRLQRLYEDVTAQMIESIGGFRDILAVGRFRKVADQFRGRSEQLRKQSLKSILWSQYGELLLNIVFGCLTVLPYYLLLEKLETVAQVGRAITYVGLLSGLLPSLAGVWGITVELSSAVPSLYALRDFLRPSDHFIPTTAVSGGQFPRAVAPVPDEVHSIRFEDVGLKLSDRWIVKDLSFELKAHELTAIIGQSGSGKTTIFHLLLRLIAPTCGSIFINDTPLEDFDEVDLRKLIGFIPQNPFIFNSTLRENLLIEDGTQDERLIADVIHAAQLDELIDARKNEGGLDSIAGYMGMSLSGGERQRIALARLLVQNPRIIVCDEYTANIDIKTAQLIQTMMQTRFAGRTRVVITHELYNARGAARILVLDQGRIVQQGTHDTLVGEPGLYQSMWEAQRII